MQEVHSAVFLQGPQGLSRKFLGRYPLLGETEALEVLAAALRRLRSRPGDMARHDGPGAHPAIWSSSPFAWVIINERWLRLLMWEVGKSYAGLGKRVRPHRRLSPGHHRGPERTGPGLLPLCHRAGDYRPDSPRPAGGGSLYGSVQLPPERNLHFGHSRPDHGQHRHLQASEARGAPLYSLACGPAATPFRPE